MYGTKKRLICLPYAGAGTSIFKDWGEYTEKLQIIPTQLPGREKRFSEKCVSKITEAIEDISSQVLPQLDDGASIALFGHSFGAILAYELAKTFMEGYQFNVVGLFVSGSPNPWERRTRRATGLSDDDFIQRVEEFAGYSHPALADRDMVEIILPALRADVEMHELYEPPNDNPLPLEITTIRGNRDLLVTAKQMQQWNKASTYKICNKELQGGHMYLTDKKGELIQLMEKILSDKNDC